MERCCDLCHITLNKNAVVGDVSAMTPGQHLLHDRNIDKLQDLNIAAPSYNKNKELLHLHLPKAACFGSQCQTQYPQLKHADKHLNNSGLCMVSSTEAISMRLLNSHMFHRHLLITCAAAWHVM